MADPLQERDVVEVIVGEGKGEWFVVMGVIPIRMTRSYSSVAAGASSTTAEQTFLNPPKSELIHVTGLGIEHGALPEHELRVTMKNPAAVTLFGTTRAPEDGWFNGDNSPPDNPAPLDQWIIYERPPAIIFNNQSDAFAIVPNLHWWGYRYLVRPMEGAPDAVGSEVHSYLFNKVVERRPRIDQIGAPLIDERSGRQLVEEITRYVPSGRPYATKRVGGFKS